MKLQTYRVVAEIDTMEPINVGQVVYEWPHVDWGLAGPDDLLICTRLNDITTIYAVPKDRLQIGEVIEASLDIGAMPGCPQPEDDARVGAGLRVRRAVSRNGQAMASRLNNPDESKIAEIVAAFRETGRYGVLTQMIREAFAELRDIAEMHEARRDEQIGRDSQIVRLINELRDHEGDDVTFLCDNPDPAAREEQAAIRCCGEWTGWQEKAFMGETVVHALQAAVLAMKLAYRARV